MSEATQTMQKDDSQNPAMLWVKDGTSAWNSTLTPQKKSCADCHGDVSSMRGVALRYPAFDTTQNRPIHLSQRINQCRVQHQAADAASTLVRNEQPQAHTAHTTHMTQATHTKQATQSAQSVQTRDVETQILGLEALIALQSRGEKIQASRDRRLEVWHARGEKLFTQRIGQIDLSCAQCHRDNANKKLAGNTIPQAHPTGYPIYRLAWQGVGNLQRRMRNCMIGVRAAPYAADSDEFAALEVYLLRRATGMVMDAPAVRP